MWVSGFVNGKREKILCLAAFIIVNVTIVVSETTRRMYAMIIILLPRSAMQAWSVGKGGNV
jgi:hypothetical protein